MIRLRSLCFVLKGMICRLLCVSAYIYVYIDTWTYILIGIIYSVLRPSATKHCYDVAHSIGGSSACSVPVWPCQDSGALDWERSSYRPQNSCRGKEAHHNLSEFTFSYYQYSVLSSFLCFSCCYDYYDCCIMLLFLRCVSSCPPDNGMHGLETYYYIHLQKTASEIACIDYNRPDKEERAAAIRALLQVGFWSSRTS